MQVSHSLSHASGASIACGAGHTLTPTALAAVLICTTIRQDSLNLHAKIHNLLILYLQIPYQPKSLRSYILRHQEASIAPKRHLALNNTRVLLSSLPAFTERELSSQLLQVITSTAVPWLSIQQTWQKSVRWSQIFFAACIYSTDAHTGSPEPSLSLCNAFFHHTLKPQKMSPVRHLPSWRKMPMRFHRKKKGSSLNQLKYPE